MSGPAANVPDRHRVAWFHAFNGIAGDMAMGACIDAGADVDAIRADLERLGLPGWSLRADRVLRGGLAATHAVVEVDGSGAHDHHRRAGAVIDLVGGADLPDRVRRRAVAVFEALARAEGALHRQSPSDVHLHEVGALDAIVDVVGTCIGLELLGIDAVHAGPVATGVGTVTAAHGVLPVPAPAVVALLAGAPVRRVDVAAELTTPTGAALLAALAESWGPMPAMVIESAGYGAGTKDFDGRVNAVQLVTGTTMPATPIGTDESQPLVDLAVNVDDITGEELAHVVDDLLGAGAADAWLTPVLMKKGRPGHVVHVLALPERAGDLADRLVTGTGSFGVRATPVQRWPAARHMDAVDVDGHPVRIKVSPRRTKVEHDDAAEVARRTGRPLREVVSLAEEAARRRRPSGADHEPDEPA